MSDNSLIWIVFLSLCAGLCIAIMLMLTLDKLLQAVRMEDEELTYIHRAWVWTQLIPVWSLFAFIAYHVKIQTAIKVLEKHYGIEKEKCAYPVIIGWLFASSGIIALIPIIGPILYLIFFVWYWVKVFQTKKIILSLKTEI